MAATLMTLGLAGLILSAGPLLPFAATGAAPRDAALAPAPTTEIPQKSQPEALGPVDGGAGMTSGPSVGGDAARDSSPAGTEGPAATNLEAATSPEVATNQITQPSLVPYASLLFVLTGIGLLVLRRIARRLR